MKLWTCACLLAFGMSAHAGETMFGYLYTTETIPKGHWEYEQSQTFRTGKARGTYNAVDLRNEFEYGITDRFQVGLYLNSSYLKTTNQYNTEDVKMDEPNRNEFNVNGTSVELIYRVLSPYSDGFGLAFYLEPELSVRDRMMGDDKIERALEMRILLQKNFLGDQLITAVNLMVEPEWEKSPEGLVQKELWAEITAGATYRLADKWYAGLEFRNHMEFVDMNLANQEHSAYFLGPSVHYGSEKFWLQITVLPQIAGWPRKLGYGMDGNAIKDNYATLGQHERFETRVKFGIPF